MKEIAVAEGRNSGNLLTQRRQRIRIKLPQNAKIGYGWIDGKLLKICYTYLADEDETTEKEVEFLLLKQPYRTPKTKWKYLNKYTLDKGVVYLIWYRIKK